jgi:apolipoprotein N-acyltransferase
VPYGEYILGERFLPWLKKILQIGTYTPGKKGKVIRNRSFPLAVLICFESIFPELSRASVKEGGRILVNITNDAWFKKTAAPYQHALMSIVRAVENRTPLIRAANTGVSLAVSASGKLLTKTEIFRKTVRKVKIKVRNTPSKSFYTQWGDVFVFVCLFYLGVLVFLKFLKKT